MQLIHVYIAKLFFNSIGRNEKSLQEETNLQIQGFIGEQKIHEKLNILSWIQSAQPF